MFYVYYNICFNINWFLLKIPSKIDTLPPSKIQSLVYWLLFNAFTNIWVCCTEQHALKENLQSSVLIKNPTPKAGCQGPQGQPSPGAWLVIVISYQNKRWQMQFYTFWMYKRGWRDAEMIQIQDRGAGKSRTNKWTEWGGRGDKENEWNDSHAEGTQFKRWVTGSFLRRLRNCWLRSQYS